MTETEIKHIEDRTLWPEDVGVRDETIDRLVAEVRRLRGLIKAREFRSGQHGSGYGTGCTWCSGFVTDGSVPVHDDDCPAFTPDGSVR